jgi:hypothetical protein
MASVASIRNLAPLAQRTHHEHGDNGHAPGGYHGADGNA